MQLDDPIMIQQAKNTHVTELEVLYWILEDALHAGNRHEAKGLLITLLYIAKYRPELIRIGLQETYMKRLKGLTYDLLDNKSTRLQQSITMKPAIQSKKIPFKMELELKQYLVDNPDKLALALGDDIKIVGVEVEAGEDYKCDIVAESDKHFYPIELKIAHGTHTAVSQCSKYCYYFYRKLRYDRFKRVQGGVCANGYDVWSVNELRRAGHWIYSIDPISDTDIVLERI